MYSISLTLCCPKSKALLFWWIFYYIAVYIMRYIQQQQNYTVILLKPSNNGTKNFLNKSVAVVSSVLYSTLEKTKQSTPTTTYGGTATKKIEICMKKNSSSTLHAIFSLAKHQGKNLLVWPTLDRGSISVTTWFLHCLEKWQAGIGKAIMHFLVQCWKEFLYWVSSTS